MTNLDSIFKSRDITLPTKVRLVKAMVFPVVMRVGLWRKLSIEEWMLLNCGVGEDSWESLGLQGDPTSPSYRRPVLNVYWKDWCSSWNANTLATWWEELTHLKNHDAGKDWGWEKGMTEDEMVEWHHQLREFTQTHVHWVSDAIQPSHPLLFLSPPALNLSQHQGFFKWVSSSHQVARLLELQLQHQSFQWIFRTYFL